MDNPAGEAKKSILARCVPKSGNFKDSPSLCKVGKSSNVGVLTLYDWVRLGPGIECAFNRIKEVESERINNCRPRGGGATANPLLNKQNCVVAFIFLNSNWIVLFVCFRYAPVFVLKLFHFRNERFPPGEVNILRKSEFDCETENKSISFLSLHFNRRLILLCFFIFNERWST